MPTNQNTIFQSHINTNEIKDLNDLIDPLINLADLITFYKKHGVEKTKQKINEINDKKRD